MNLVEALNVALPELPAKTARKKAPKLDPRVAAREHIEEDGAPTIFAHLPGGGEFFRFTPEQWQILELFDGERDYSEISEAYYEKTGILLAEDWLRNYATDLEFTNFWYKSPQERNSVLMRQLAEKRSRKLKKAYSLGNLADIRFPAWDPDVFLTKVHSVLKFAYTRWFTALTLCLFAFMLYIFITDWSEISRDTLQFYNFTEKGFSDIVEFWLLFFVLVFSHESAHGVTCKHFGGGVHQMGFNLLYLTPCFYVDMSELWVYASRWERVAAMLAGLWVEMIYCSLGAMVWKFSAPGTFAHELSYKVMLVTGIGAVLISLNPLIKLDGYYMMTEILRLQDLKERSTALVSSWTKKYLFRLPVEVEYVPRRRRWIYVPYAILSGAYSYLLLFTVSKFAYNVAFSYSKQWAWLFGLGLALFIFKSRIKALVRFMKVVYLDKREAFRDWFTPLRTAMVALAVLVILLAPFWRESVEGRFVVEPGERAVIRASVPGTVVQTWGSEGEPLQAGAPLLRLRNLALESQAGLLRADYHGAAARLNQAVLQNADYAAAMQERSRLQEQVRLANEQEAGLLITTPIQGTLVTPRLQDRMGSYIEAGTVLAEVDDNSQVRVRVFVSEFDVRKVKVGNRATAYFDALLDSRSGKLEELALESREIEPGLIHESKYKGMRPPHYYLATVWLDNPGGRLKPGMTGTAKIYTAQGRRSLGQMLARTLGEFLGRTFW